MTEPVRRLDFGRVSVFFGEKSGKYPDGNQVVVRGSGCPKSSSSLVPESTPRP